MKRIPLKSVYIYPATNGYVIEHSYRPDGGKWDEDTDRKTLALTPNDIGEAIRALFDNPWLEIEE